MQGFNWMQKVFQSTLFKHGCNPSFGELQLIGFYVLFFLKLLLANTSENSTNKFILTQSKDEVCEPPVEVQTYFNSKYLVSGI